MACSNLVLDEIYRNSSSVDRFDEISGPEIAERILLRHPRLSIHFHEMQQRSFACRKFLSRRFVENRNDDGDLAVTSH